MDDEESREPLEISLVRATEEMLVEGMYAFFLSRVELTPNHLRTYLFSMDVCTQREHRGAKYVRA